VGLKSKGESGATVARPAFDSDGYLNWEIPEFGLVLRLRRSALEEARQRSVAALKSLPRRGVETGGVLVGYVAPGLIEVDEFREVLCAHLFGPSYRLTDEETLGLFSDSGGEPARPVAFWRSNLRDQSVPDAHDTAVAREGAAPDLILLLQPGLEGEMKLVCCVLGADGIWKASEAPSVIGPEAKAASLATAAAWAPERASASARHTGLPGTLWWVGAAVLALILAALAFAILRSPGVPKQAADPYVDLGFRAERAGPDIRLTWNGRLPVIASAYGGTLRINDGGLYRSVDLNAAQTRSGSLVYSPQSDDIEFRLEIYGDQNRSYGEGTRVILPAKR
jgi:hypothetical protein